MKEKFNVTYLAVVYNLFKENNIKYNDCVLKINEIPDNYQNIDKIKEKYRLDFILLKPKSDALYCIYKNSNNKLSYTTIEHSFEIFCKNDKTDIISECIKNERIFDAIKLFRMITNNHIFIYTTNVKVSNENLLIDDAIVDTCAFPSIYFINDLIDIKDNDLERRFNIPIDYELYMGLIKRDNFLKIAHTYYDDSFFQHNLNTKFLLLFASLETFFNTSPNDIKYKISLYTSTLISNDPIERKKAFDRIKKLYDLRSNFVHSKNKGKEKGQKNITPDDEFELREYVRLVILRYIEWSIKTKKSSQKLFIEYIDDIIFSGKNPLSFENYN